MKTGVRLLQLTFWYVAILCLFVLPLMGFSNFPQDSASEFRSYFQATSEARGVSVEQQKGLLFLPDHAVIAMQKAQSLEEALNKLREADFDQLATATFEKESVSLHLGLAREKLRRQAITIVLIPGVFGEFIEGRAFEEIFSRSSTFQSEFRALIEKNKSSTLVSESRFDLNAMADVKTSLGEMISAGSIDDEKGQILAKVILFNTPMGSLESLGDISARARVFNRRLEKYLQLTGDKNLLFVGYSRGTTIGLEMLSQAHASSWIQKVHGMVSLGGVVLGSALADDLSDEDSYNSKMVSIATALMNGLNELPDREVGENVVKFAARTALVKIANGLVWAKFVADMNLLTIQFPAASLKNLANLDMRADPSAIYPLAQKMWLHLGLDKPIADYSNNVKRFKHFLAEILLAVDQLRTEKRMDWWKTHTVPSSLVYYSMPAIMPDPMKSELQKDMWDRSLGFNDTIDDQMLQNNRREYERLSGVSLNDSQVSVAQASFLPSVLSSLNSAQPALKTQFLGMLGTHHWGLALGVVNKMKTRTDGRTDRNPFPREALLEALAVKAAADREAAEPR